MHKLLLILIPFCMSCIWDRDTLAHDGHGRLDAAKTIVGWFDRYPPTYYEMRLARVLKELETTPENLELYDDAAVALDRLHRSNEAIAMMTRKKAALERQKSTGDEKLIWEHQYRYLANLGTFYAHRWIGTERAEKKTDLSDLAEAERLIKAAIDHNPDAHFGREKYQLQAIQWLQMPADEAELVIPLGLLDISATTRGRTDNTTAEDSNNRSAIQGLLGMMQLGAAWQSIDFNQALTILLSVERRGALAWAARLRVKELREMGMVSLHPKLVDGSKYEEDHYFPEAAGKARENAEIWFTQSRQAADIRNKKREEFMAAKFAKGQHPDTHLDFWTNWQEPKFPDLGEDNEDSEDSAALSSYLIDLSTLWWAFVLITIVIILIIIKLIRNSNRA